MSSGGSSFSSSKSPTTTENISTSKLADSQDNNSHIKKDFDKVEKNTKQAKYLEAKFPGFTSADQIHHYARGFIMVQR